MGSQGKAALFEKAINELTKNGDELSIQIMGALRDAYLSNNHQGVSLLFDQIRNKYQIDGEKDENQ